jgi:ssDNA-binding Zn-finger/Zn-ribbon topoisomerase 1
MGLLLQCRQCGTLFGDCICPKCGSIEAPAEFQRQRVLIETFRQRKQQCEIHQAISISLVFGLIATSTALLMLGWMTRFWEPMFGLAYHTDAISNNSGLAGLLGIASILLSVLCLKARAWWPVELMCPSCNYRLAGPRGKIVDCPQCDAHFDCARRLPNRIAPRRTLGGPRFKPGTAHTRRIRR